MDFIGACFIAVGLGTNSSHHKRSFANDCKFRKLNLQFFHHADVFKPRFVHLGIIDGDQLFDDIFHDELM